MYMRLVIKNIHKVIGDVYQTRFVCINAVETDVNYRFQFRDNGYTNSRIVWVEVNRNGRWDVEDKKWYYPLNYPNVGGGHWISADWWGDMKNVKLTFDEVFKGV